MGFLLLVFAIVPALAFAQCNGDTSLCNRRFDQVCFLYTHNSYNVRGPHKLPNQNLGVVQQLDLGVRGLMLDVYRHGDETMVYHGHRVLGHRPLQADLQDIREWLESHPWEVMSIIFESHVDAAVLAEALAAAGLVPMLHVQAAGAPWPTLAAMVASGRRLVVFSEKDQGNPYPWILHAWDWMTENHYSNHSCAAFDARYNRGDSTHSLFLLNHFVTHRRFGFGLQDSAQVANGKGMVLDHALQAWSTTAHFPNFVAVDFVELGDAKAAVDSLNAQWRGEVHGHEAALMRSVVWMVADRQVVVTLTQPVTATVSLALRDVLTGDVLAQQCSQVSGVQAISLPVGMELPDGAYRVELWWDNHFERRWIHLTHPAAKAPTGRQR